MTSTELGYLSGVTSNIQDQLNGKANTWHVYHNNIELVSNSGHGGYVDFVQTDGSDYDARIMYRDNYLNFYSNNVFAMKFNNDWWISPIKEGNSGIWHYRWNETGFTECWALVAIGNTPVTTAWGNLYESGSAIGPYAFPVEFSNARYGGPPRVIFTLLTNNGIILESYGVPTNTQTQQCFLVRPTSATSTTVYIGIYAFGWQW